MSIREEYLEKLAADLEIPLSRDMIGQFSRYADLLVQWNLKINLTAITAPDEIVVKHFIDSLIPLTLLPSLQEGAKVVDIGTGAGFPGIPWKIARPDLDLTLLDSLNKRIGFLNEVLSSLSLGGKAVHMRAEDGGRKQEYRERFDLATARAVASLGVLAEYCLPYVKAGGYFAALKGGEVEEELEQAKYAIRLLGGKCRKVFSYSLPDGSGRSLVLIQKISQTSTKYPRSSSQMAKKPLAE